MSLSLKDLLYYLNFKDEETWNRNKDMLGYIRREKYEDFFFRKHGFKHTEQSYESGLFNITFYEKLILMEKDNVDLKNTVKSLEITIKNMESQLTKLVKGYTPVSKLLIRDY